MPDQYVSSGAAWFTLSLINAGLAQSKGRRGLVWWAVSLLLGPVATLLIVVWPPVVDGIEEVRKGTMTSGQSVSILLVLLIAGVAIAAAVGVVSGLGN